MSLEASNSLSRAKPTSLSKRLRDFRASAGLTQYGMAKELEVHPSTVVRWENGTTQPKAAHIRRLYNLAKQFQVDLDFFND